jgi:hypothetical protein
MYTSIARQTGPYLPLLQSISCSRFQNALDNPQISSDCKWLSHSKTWAFKTKTTRNKNISIQSGWPAGGRKRWQQSKRTFQRNGVIIKAAEEKRMVEVKVTHYQRERGSKGWMVKWEKVGEWKVVVCVGPPAFCRLTSKIPERTTH